MIDPQHTLTLHAVTRMPSSNTGSCQHSREHRRCKECGGASICQQSRQCSKFKECRGSAKAQSGEGAASASNATSIASARRAVAEGTLVSIEPLAFIQNVAVSDCGMMTERIPANYFH